VSSAPLRCNYTAKMVTTCNVGDAFEIFYDKQPVNQQSLLKSLRFLEQFNFVINAKSQTSLKLA